jgi:hypothetical protein
VSKLLLLRSFYIRYCSKHIWTDIYWHKFAVINYVKCNFLCRSQWLRGLRRGSAVAVLLRLWVLKPPGTWMFAYCEWCTLSGRVLSVGLVTRPEESYRVWRLWVLSRSPVRGDHNSESGRSARGGCNIFFIFWRTVAWHFLRPKTILIRRQRKFFMHLNYL